MQSIQDGNVPKPKLSDKVRTSPKPFQSYVDPPLGQEADYSDRDIERTKSDIDHDAGLPDYDMMEEQQWKESGQIHSSAQEFNNEARSSSPNLNPPSGKPDYGKPEGGAGDLKAQMEYARQYRPSYSSTRRKPRLTGSGRVTQKSSKAGHRIKEAKPKKEKEGDCWEQAGYIRINPDEDGFPKLYRRSSDRVGTPPGYHQPFVYNCPRCMSEAKRIDEYMEWRSPEVTDVKWHITLHCRICNLSWKDGEEENTWREVREQASAVERFDAGVCPSCMGWLDVEAGTYIGPAWTDDAIATCEECGKHWRCVNGKAPFTSRSEVIEIDDVSRLKALCAPYNGDQWPDKLIGHKEREMIEEQDRKEKERIDRMTPEESEKTRRIDEENKRRQEIESEIVLESIKDREPLPGWDE